MTARRLDPFTGPRREPPADRSWDIPRAPAEGWASVGLLLVMLLCMALAVDDAGWVVRGALTDFLVWAVFFGMVAGFIAAKVGWSRWVAHPVGAIFAALILSIIIGSILHPSGFVSEWFRATASASVNAVLDVTVHGRATTTQYGHFMLLFGILAWATGQYAAYTAYAHRRPVAAVLMIGAILVTNMAITSKDQLVYLVAFSLAALIFLVRMHALDEKRSLSRYRVEDVGAAMGRYLRAGAGFVAVAVAGALVLTATASSAPLSGAWGGIDQRITEIASQFSRLLPGGGVTRVGGLVFGDQSVISGQWVTDATPIMSIHVPDDQQYSWRVATYDELRGLPGAGARAGNPSSTPATRSSTGLPISRSRSRRGAP